MKVDSLKHSSSRSTATNQKSDSLVKTVEDKLQEFTLYNLLGHSKPEHHEGIRILWADPKVDYLVLFADPRLKNKAILTVGKDYDYKSLEEIASIKVDGMKAVAFVKSRFYAQQGDSTPSRLFRKLSGSHPPVDTYRYSAEDLEEKPTTNGQIDSDFDEQQASQVPMLRAEVDEPRAKAATPKTSEADSEDGAWAAIKKREVELENLNQELLAREAFITESENRLLEISQQHHERQEELNHKLDSLKKFEMQLEERERRIAKLETASK